MRAGLLLGALMLASPACADHWFGAVNAACDSFAACSATPNMPDQPADSASLYLRRAGTANAPVEIYIHVNKPVAAGVPIRFAFGQTAIELPAGDVQTRREGDRATGYWIAESRVAELLAAMRKVDVARLTIPVGGQPQDLAVTLEGLDDALRFFDQRQGRTGAQDALIEAGARLAADAAAPKPLPARDAWPKQIERIFKRERCEDRLATFDDLTTGFIAAPARGRALWQIPCAGSNYNIHFLLIEIRDGDPKTARRLSFPTRSRARADSVVTNPVWWDARKELSAFERGRAHGDCGTVARYAWSARGFVLIDERAKDDCDGRFDDPWTKWPAVKSGRGRKR